MTHVPGHEAGEKTPGETSWWLSPYFRTYPGGKGLEGGTNGGTPARIALAQSFPFILVRRSELDQSLRQPTVPKVDLY